MLTFQSLSGEELNQYIPALAQLRIQVFREYPYLYDGDLAYEERYLQTYINSPNSIIVLAFDGDNVVGASTGIPLQHETEEVKRPFLAAGLDIESIFYCGESVLLPEYRGQGAGVAFFQLREAHANLLGSFRYSCFCAVQRPDNHPERPDDFTPLDVFWQRRGYHKQEDLSTTFSWKEVGESQESLKPMTFWMKTLP